MACRRAPACCLLWRCGCSSIRPHLEPWRCAVDVCLRLPLPDTETGCCSWPESLRAVHAGA